MDNVRPCESFDASRLSESYLFGLVSIVSLGAGLVFANLTSAPMLAMYIGGGFYFASHALNRNMLYRCAQKSYKRWRTRGGALEFAPCWHFLLWDIFSIVILSTTAGVMIWLTLSGAAAYSGRMAMRIIAIALVLLTFSVAGLISLPFGRFSAPAIVVDSGGILLWPAGRYRVAIPWRVQPKVVGCLRRNGQTVFLIETENGSSFYFPMTILPLGGVQFQKIVELYSSNPAVRRQISAPKELVRIRSLMDAPICEVIKDLDAD